MRAEELQYLLFGLGVRALVESVLGVELPLLVRGLVGVWVQCGVVWVLCSVL